MISAVACLHEPDANGFLVIHRDIKTSNILIKTDEDDNERLILSDFGSAIKLKNGGFAKGQYGTLSKILN